MVFTSVNKGYLGKKIFAKNRKTIKLNLPKKESGQLFWVGGSITFPIDVIIKSFYEN